MAACYGPEIFMRILNVLRLFRIKHYVLLVDMLTVNKTSQLVSPYFLPPRVLLLLHYALIHPHISYGYMLWARNSYANFKRAQILQNKTLRLVGGYVDGEQNTTACFTLFFASESLIAFTLRSDSSTYFVWLHVMGQKFLCEF